MIILLVPHQWYHSCCYLSQGWSKVWVFQCSPILPSDMHEKVKPSWPGVDSWILAGKRHHVTEGEKHPMQGFGEHVSCISRQLYVVFAVFAPAEKNYVDSEIKRQEGPGVGWGAGIFPNDSTGTFLISWGLIWDKRLVLWAWIFHPVLGLMDPFPWWNVHSLFYQL